MVDASKNIVVVGMAESGRAVAQLACRQGHHVVGMDARTDVNPIDGVELQLGPHDRERLCAADLVITSPGVPFLQPDLVAARDAGVTVVGEMGYAAGFLNIPIVAITGTNGKSTVTSFVGQILRAAGRKPFVGGNFGVPLSEAVGGDYGIAVVEVSSYQLEMPGEFTPQVAAILNLTPDHLGRHGTMENYARTKCEVLRRVPKDGVALLPAMHSLLTESAKAVYDGAVLWLGARPGVTREGDVVRIDLGMQSWQLSLEGFTIPGDHNLDNAATAAAICLSVGVSASVVQEALRELVGLPHRMERVSTEDGLYWINDSKATNVDAATVGIRGMPRPGYVLLGGQAKGPGFEALRAMLIEQKGVVAFGGSGADIADELNAVGVTCTRVATMEAAVDHVRGCAESGDVVLLSPGCASFDAYRNFEHRGDVFRDYVQMGRSEP